MFIPQLSNVAVHSFNFSSLRSLGNIVIVGEVIRYEARLIKEQNTKIARYLAFKYGAHIEASDQKFVVLPSGNKLPRNETVTRLIRLAHKNVNRTLRLQARSLFPITWYLRIKI